MPSKITSEGRGSGMTRHTRTMRIYDMTQPLTDAEADAFEKALEAMGRAAAPWRWFETEILIAERTIKAIESGAPGSEDPDIFKPHAGAGWYSQEILNRAKWIEGARKSENWELVARFSFELGRLSTTIGLKNLADDDVKAGVAIKTAQQDAAAATRLWSRDERIAAIQTVLDQGRLGIGAAIKAAAKQNPGRGSWQAFEADWYAKKAP